MKDREVPPGTALSWPYGTDHLVVKGEWQPIGLPPFIGAAYRILDGEEAPEAGWSEDELREARRLHWSRITSHLDPSPMEFPEIHAPREKAVMWRLHCPACSAKMALFGIDAERKHLHQDAVWMHVYRRVSQQYHGVDESYSEGEYDALLQVRLTCGTPRCRGFEKYRLETIVKRMHALRDTHSAGTVIADAAFR